MRGRRGRRLRPARSAGAAGRAAVRQSAPLGAAALARRRADRALADGRRVAAPRWRRCCWWRQLDAGPVAALEQFDVGPGRGRGRRLRARARPRAGSPCARARRCGARPARDGAAGRRGDLRRQDHGGRPPCSILPPGARAARPGAGPLAAHRRAAVARRRAAHHLAHARPDRGPSRPGVLERDGDAVVLGCGEGALELCELQPPGGRRMPAADWLRGLRGHCRRRRARERRPHARAARPHARVRRGRLRRSRLHGRGREVPRSTPASAPSRCTSRSARCSVGARWTPRWRSSPSGRCSGSSAARARPAARRLPDPVRRRNPTTCSGFRERRARAA